MTRGDRARKRDQHQRAADEMQAPTGAVGMLRQVVRIELAKTRVHAKTVTDGRPYSAMPLSQGQGRVQRVMQYSFQNPWNKPNERVECSSLFGGSQSFW